MKNVDMKTLAIAGGYVLAAILCVTTFAVFVALSPEMPGAGLDPSWKYALNEAVARHLVFGRDIIFTYGPYAALYTRVYHPATDGLMIGGGVLLWAAYTASLLLLARGRRFFWLLPVVVFFAGIYYWQETLFFSYPLILCLVIYRLTLPVGHPERLVIPSRGRGAIALLFIPLGLLPLVKGTFLLCTVPAALLSAAMLWRWRERALAIAAILVPPLGAVVFWHLAGQPLSALPDFLASLGLIISGYTEAMALPGNFLEIFLYLLASGLLAYIVVLKPREPLLRRLFLLGAYAIFLFICFKAAFVRHDEHAFIAGASILLAALLLPFVVAGRMPFILLPLAVLSWGAIEQARSGYSPGGMVDNIARTYALAFEGLRTRLDGSGILRKTYERKLAELRQDFGIPRLPGTADIYSYHQAYLLAAGNQWSPRPVLQSYSSYNPALSSLDERHLRSDSAPDQILFRIEPIDGRLPALEDGMSWPTLANRYSVRAMYGRFALLQKRPMPADGAGDGAGADATSSVAEHRMGEAVLLPESRRPVFAAIDVRPTLLGRLLALAFKPPELRIALTLADGRTRTYRYIAAMGRSRFLLSPLVATAMDYVLLTGARGDYLAGNRVVSMLIAPVSDSGLFWERQFTLRLMTAPLTADTDLAALGIFDRIAGAPALPRADSAVTCEGYIDAVNGRLSSSPGLVASATLSINGWMAVDARNGRVPEAVFVTLKDAAGRVLYVRTHSVPRSDVRAYFSRPDLPDPGFAALADLSHLEGRYVVGLARAVHGKLETCKQFNLPLLVTR